MALFNKREQPLGTEIDAYRMVGVLGRGGMGTVYKAIHTWTGREVAVKFLHPHLAGNERNIRRFMKEARAATALHHPNVVDVLHMGKQAGGDVYLVMELLHGTSLRTLLGKRGPLSETESLAYVLPVIDALHRAHTLGMVHRDIKPDNIFIAERDAGPPIPKLLDFGVAKLADHSGSSGTITGALLGTPQYMSPEQANGEPDIGPATDIWAIGMVLHECLTGELPFRSCTSLPALLLRLVTEDVPSVVERYPNISKHIVRAIDTSLRRERTERFASMADFSAALGAPLHVGTPDSNTPIPDSNTLIVEAPAVDHGLPIAGGGSSDPPSYGPVENHKAHRATGLRRGLVATVAVVLGTAGMWHMLAAVSEDQPAAEAAPGPSLPQPAAVLAPPPLAGPGLADPAVARTAEAARVAHEAKGPASVATSPAASAPDGDVVMAQPEAPSVAAQEPPVGVEPAPGSGPAAKPARTRASMSETSRADAIPGRVRSPARAARVPSPAAAADKPRRTPAAPPQSERKNAPPAQIPATAGMGSTREQPPDVIDEF